ncbi:MAG TPA: HAD-IB family hydrolase, partial [Acidimicrobiales bacterium]|nr:HAD-IB family hydrolase [Acidimicrobiales bacterium]
PAVPPPDPTATQAPDPTASRAPDPTATQAPDPTASRAPDPTATQAPDPTASRAPDPTATQAPAARRAAFFGLDTLIPGSSLYLLAQGLQRRHFYGRADLVGFAWTRLALGRGGDKGARMQTPSAAALSFAAGRHRPELRALAQEIADERIVPLVYPDLAELIEAHRAAGMLTFVATAAPAELAEIVAHGLGMTGGLGTTAEVDDGERYSGRLVGSVLQGPAKAGAVEAHAAAAGIDLSFSVAYSDSINDLPLLELVGRAVVVNPDRQLRKVAQRRGWAVHDVRPATRRPMQPGAAPVPHRVAALGLSAGLQADGEPARRGATHHFTTEDPTALLHELEQSGRFRRDTRLGNLFHRGKVSLREVSPTHSLHITVGKGNRVSAHVDRYSPLATSQPEKAARYSLHRVAAHNVAGIAGDVARLLPGRNRRRRRRPCPRPPT